MQQLVKTEAIVLHSQRWSESSKIVHLFTEKQGYIKAIAKGAHRAKSPFRGVMEALNHIELLINVKESRGLQLITSAAALHSFIKIRENLNKTAVAFSVLELIKQLYHSQQAAPGLFQYLIRLLLSLNESQRQNLKPYLWHVLLHFSQELGFGWSLRNCLNCGKAPREFPVLLASANGGIYCRNCTFLYPAEGLSIQERQWQSLCLIHNIEPEKLDEMECGSDNRAEINITNNLLQHLIIHTETPIELKSLKWYAP